MKNHTDLQELQDFLRAALRDPASRSSWPSRVATKPSAGYSFPPP